MQKVTESAELLRTLGQRLRRARLARDDSMSAFSERLGVSERTLRAMERGEPTVQVGTWVEALWILDRLDELRPLLAPKESLLDRARNRPTRPRQRASRRPR